MVKFKCLELKYVFNVFRKWIMVHTCSQGCGFLTPTLLIIYNNAVVYHNLMNQTVFLFHVCVQDSVNIIFVCFTRLSYTQSDMGMAKLTPWPNYVLFTTACMVRLDSSLAV